MDSSFRALLAEVKYLNIYFIFVCYLFVFCLGFFFVFVFFFHTLSIYWFSEVTEFISGFYRTTEIVNCIYYSYQFDWIKLSNQINGICRLQSNKFFGGQLKPLALYFVAEKISFYKRNLNWGSKQKVRIVYYFLACCFHSKRDLMSFKTHTQKIRYCLSFYNGSQVTVNNVNT